MPAVPEPGDSVVDRLRRLCDAAIKTVPASGAGLSVIAAGRQFGPLTAADPISERLEELQFVLGEGPGVDALAERRPILVPDLEVDGPGCWPIYAPAAWDLGVRSIFAFPLQIGTVQLGVLDLFRAEPSSLSNLERGHAFMLVAKAVEILLDGEVRRDVADATEPASTMVTGPTELFQAQDMVMIQTGGTLADAMVRIRAYAFAENRRIGEVARAIVAGELEFNGSE
jgi:GAF domain-containing protein